MAGRKKKFTESLGVGMAASTIAPTAVNLAHKVITRPVVSPLLNNIGKKTLTDEESAAIYKELLGDRKINIEDYPALMSHFDPGSNTVRAPKNSYVFAHELGHASSPFGAGRIGAFFTHGLGGPILAPLIRSIDSAQKAYNRKKGYDPKDDSTALSVASTATQLAEEAQASIRGARAIGKVKGSKEMWRAARQVFGPAYGTYVAAALGSHALAPWVGKHIGEYLAKE